MHKRCSWKGAWGTPALHGHHALSTWLYGLAVLDADARLDAESPSGGLVPEVAQISPPI